MKASIPFVVAAITVLPAVVHAAPAPKADPRFTQALRRAEKAYKKVGTFSITSVDSLIIDEETLSKRSTGRFSTDGRMALKVEELDEEGQPTGVVTKRVFNGLQLIQSVADGPETRHALPQFLGQSTSLSKFFVSALGLGFVREMVRPKGPDMKSGMARDRFVYHGLGGGRVQLEVRAYERDEDEETVNKALLFINLDPDGYIERLTAKVETDGEIIYHVQSVLSRPLPLRGKDAFNWATFAPDPIAKFSISPQSRAAFARAAKLYGGLRSFAMDFKAQTDTTGEGETNRLRETGLLAFSRRGLLRYELSTDDKVVVSDGRNSWFYSDGTYERAAMTERDRGKEVLDLLSEATDGGNELGGTTAYFTDFLRGEPSLATLSGFKFVTATFHPNRPQGDTLCDLVLIKSLMEDEDGKTRIESRLWFARDDGRALRIAVDFKYEDGSTQRGTVSFNNQKLNPFLPPSTWKFVPPEGAEDITDDG
ncbi:outer membrane lipoprotein carrier protein LolA [bacterium]|nr:MAG: outer membrane lipoprotein carrier protein LolA [bacterium]